MTPNSTQAQASKPAAPCPLPAVEKGRGPSTPAPPPTRDALPPLPTGERGRGAGARRRPLVLGAVLLAALSSPTPAEALPSNCHFGLAGAVASAVAGPVASAVLSAGCWVGGPLEAEARLSLGGGLRAAPPGAAPVLSSEVGLRAVAEAGRWRPWLGASAGVALPGGPGAGAAAAVRGQVGLERFLLPDLSAGLALGAGWTRGEGVAGEATLGVRLYF